MTNVAFGNPKSTIQSSLGLLLAIVMATVSLISIPSSAPKASAEAFISQLGVDIDGEAAGDASGWSVAMSSDGSRVAIGARQNDGNGSNAGHVRIYDYNGSSWTQVGLDIDGEAAFDSFGGSVALSSDGSRVAIGAYSNDGNGSNAGHVRIYDYNGSSWTQVGVDIDGEAAGDYFGAEVALSSNGSRVAIGAYLNDGNGTDAGHVRIYDYNGSSWTQVGVDIDGEAAEDQSGHRVELSSDGSRVAIGARFNDGNGSNAGQVRIYDYNGSSWTQVGVDIDGEAAGDYLGSAVALSSNGSRVAIGARFNDGNGTDAGHVRIYDYNGSSWTQVGVDIDGEAAEDRFGFSVALSRDGSRVANGAVWNDGNGSNAGHVRIFSIVQAAAPSAPRAPVLPRLDNFNIETGENGQPQLRIEGKRLWCISSMTVDGMDIPFTSGFSTPWYEYLNADLSGVTPGKKTLVVQSCMGKVTYTNWLTIPSPVEPKSMWTKVSSFGLSEAAKAKIAAFNSTLGDGYTKIRCIVNSANGEDMNEAFAKQICSFAQSNDLWQAEVVHETKATFTGRGYWINIWASGN
jgi:hypothetical protein